MTPQESYEERAKALKDFTDMDPGLLTAIREFEMMRNYERESAMMAQALQQAITETVQRLASVIINERRAEIEAACNFGELRDVLAAELARQFMASRLTGQPTPFDPRIVGSGGAAQGQMQPTNKQQAIANLGMQSYAKGTSKP